MAILVADTNEKLRALLSIGLYAPDDVVWVLVPQATYDGPFAPELGGQEEQGDDPVLMRDRVYGIERPEGAYVAVGRTGLSPSGEPTGNYQRLSDAEFEAWVQTFGADAFYVAVPPVEVEEVV